MNEIDILKILLIIFGSAVLMIMVLDRFKVPSVIGFILAGIAIGPHGLALIKDISQVEAIASFGIILLLFTIGIEFSLEDINKVLRPIFLGGSIQVTSAILMTVPIIYWFTGDLKLALITGFLISMSSTAIVLKLLQDSGDINSVHGRHILSILIFQDLAVIFFTFSVELMAKNTFQIADVLLIIIKAIAFILLILVAAKYLVPRLFDRIVSTGSRELFIISLILLITATTLISAVMGLSLALGAFIAGLILADSKYSHQALSYMLPFKESFSGLFFISIGMFMDLRFLASNLHYVLLALVLFSTIKVISTTLAMAPLRQHPRTTIFTSLALFQIGEFSFVIALLAKNLGLIPEFEYQMFVATSVLTMGLTPFVYSLAPRISEVIGGNRFIQKVDINKIKKEIKELPLKNHVIVIGFGITGKNLVKAFRALDIPHVILDINNQTVTEYLENGYNIFYGDGTNVEILGKLGIAEAKAIVVATSDSFSTKKIVSIGKHLNEDIHMIVRTKYLSDVDSLKKSGATDVVSEELEAMIEIYTRTLNLLFVPRNVISEQVEMIRSESYEMQRVQEKAAVHIVHGKDILPGIEVESYFINEDSSITGKSLSEVRLPQMTGVLVLAVKRNEIIYPNPEAHFKIKKGDTLILTGSGGQLNDANIFLNNHH